jgi:hypothetical protein
MVQIRDFDFVRSRIPLKLMPKDPTKDPSSRRSFLQGMVFRPSKIVSAIVNKAFTSQKVDCVVVALRENHADQLRQHLCGRSAEDRVREIGGVRVSGIDYLSLGGSIPRPDRQRHSFQSLAVLRLD